MDTPLEQSVAPSPRLSSLAGKKGKKVLKKQPPPPAHPALSIPDILEEIIEPLSISGRAIAARISSRWLSIALGKLWKDLDSVLPLLSLISPLDGGYAASSVISFRNTLRDVNWARFDSYARRVRSLNWNDDHGILSSEIFAQIFIHRPHTHPLIPHIRAIYWTASCDRTVMQLLPMACHGSLKTLKLRIKNNCSADSVATTLKGLDDRCVRFEDFELETWFNVGAIELPLVSYLCDQAELRRVGLPEYYGTKPIVAILGTLPALEVVQMTNRLDETIVGMQWELGEGSFKSLSTLGFNASLPMAEALLTRNSLSHISAISIKLPSAGAFNGGIRPFLLALATPCPGLRSIHLNFNQYPPEIPAIATTDLTPLLNLGGLEILEIADRRPVIRIDELFVSKMAYHWPKLRRLQITPEPAEAVPDVFGNPLSILRAFATSFGSTGKTLESLGLYFRVNVKALIDTRSTDTLPALSELNVGTSHIPEGGLFPVAAFLGGLCGPGLILKAGRQYTEPPINLLGVVQDESPTVARWKQTATAMRMIHDFQSPLRFKLEVLESSAGRRGQNISWRQTSRGDS
ncbi:hypothetical protein FRB93_005739 [Tulasnella sp. JGI-2019a]|nr:hypothetical protein FRB93_005739 [Tulasnella sp. JGI-2019a]